MRRIKFTSKTFIYALIVLLAFFMGQLVKYIFCPFIVSGNSMFPTYKDRQLVFGSRNYEYSELTPGVIVCFKYKSSESTHTIILIKRIVAKENDTLYIKDGILYVNDKESPYQFEPITNAGILSEPYTVPHGYVFCMGDNRNHSSDCRDFGAINFSEIIAIIQK